MATTTTKSAGQQTASFLDGGGELGALMRSKDWSATPLGAPETWSAAVKTTVRLCLNSPFPILLWLGPELRLVYNDAHIPFLGEAKHPAMLGAPGREAWGEIWPTIGPMHDEVRAGRATWVEDMQLFFARRLPVEEVYVTFSYSPIFGDEGRTVEGTLNVCTETTERVLGERRLSTLRGLGLLAPEHLTVDAACRHAADMLAANPADIPFAAIYVIDEGGRTARLVAGTPLADGHAAFPRTQPLTGPRARQPWPFAEVMRSQIAVDVRDLARGVGLLRGPLWPDKVDRAVILPLPASGQQRLSGFLVVGINPRRVLDTSYRAFLDLAAEHIAASLVEARCISGRAAARRRSWPSSIGPRPRSSPTSATNSARRSR